MAKGYMFGTNKDPKTDGLVERGPYETVSSVGQGDGDDGHHYISFQSIPEGIYRKGEKDWSPEIRAHQEDIAKTIGWTESDPRRLLVGRSVNILGTPGLAVEHGQQTRVEGVISGGGGILIYQLPFGVYNTPAGGYSLPQVYALTTEVAAAVGLTPDKLRRGVSVLDIAGTLDPIPGRTNLVLGSVVISNSTYEDGCAQLYVGPYNSQQFVYLRTNQIDYTFYFNGTVRGRLFMDGYNGSTEWAILECSGAQVGMGQYSDVRDFSGGLHIRLKPNGSQVFTSYSFGICKE